MRNLESIAFTVIYDVQGIAFATEIHFKGGNSIPEIFFYFALLSLVVRYKMYILSKKLLLFIASAKK